MTTTKMTKWKEQLSVIPNEVVAPSPFEIYSPKQKLGYRSDPLILRYGKLEMRISGHKLNTKDADVFLTLTKLAVERQSLKFKTSIRELCRKLNSSYTPESKASIRKSFRRLKGSWIETVYFSDDGKEENENWAMHDMVIYASNPNKDELDIVLDPLFNRLFTKTLLTYYNSDFRLSLKGDIAKHMYMFLQRQRSAKQTSKYKIGLKKLCDNIGYDRDNKRPLPSKRFKIKEGAKELVKRGYLKSYRLKDDILHVIYNPEHGKNQPAIDVEFEEVKKETDSIKYAEQKIGVKFRRNRVLIGKDITKVKAIGKALGESTLFERYVGYISESYKANNDRGWLDIINHSVFSSNNKSGGVFKRFMEYMGYDMPSDESIDKQFKRLTESEMERKKRLDQEDKERKKQERNEQEKKEAVNWADNCARNNLKEMINIDINIIMEMTDAIKKNNGKGWRKPFEEFCGAVEKKHQSEKGKRHVSYPFLFRIGSPVWKEILGPIE